MATPGIIALLWLLVDFVLNTGEALNGPDWWVDRLSLGLAASLVGTAVWLRGWMRMQRAAVADPLHERQARARQLFLSVVLVASALPAFSFTVGALWLVLRMAIGMPHDPGTVASTLQYLEAALVTGVLAPTMA